MITAIENSVRMSAIAGATRTARPMRVVTNASPGARETLQGLGFAVQALNADELSDPSVADIDADIVVLDRSLAALWSCLGVRMSAPVVFIDGLASLQAGDGSNPVDGCRADATRGALDLAATFAGPAEAEPAGEGLTCGKLLLQKSRAFWGGVDLDLTVGEYRIVELLASSPGQHFTYRAIYDRLRHEGFIAGEGPRGYWGNVRSAIRRIRNKFRAVDPAFDEIENYSGFGYCWRKAR